MAAAACEQAPEVHLPMRAAMRSLHLQLSLAVSSDFVVKPETLFAGSGSSRSLSLPNLKAYAKAHHRALAIVKTFKRR